MHQCTHAGFSLFVSACIRKWSVHWIEDFIDWPFSQIDFYIGGFAPPFSLDTCDSVSPHSRASVLSTHLSLCCSLSLRPSHSSLSPSLSSCLPRTNAHVHTHKDVHSSVHTRARMCSFSVPNQWLHVNFWLMHRLSARVHLCDLRSQVFKCISRLSHR